MRKFFKKSIVKFYLLLSLGFGILMGIVFPFYASFFVKYSSASLEVFFKIGCIVAGILVGLFSFIIGKITILKLLKKVSNELEEMASEQGVIKNRVTVESADEVGDMIKHLNEFIDKLEKLVINVKSSAEKNVTIGNELTGKSDRSSTAIEHIAYSIEKIKDQFQDLNTSIGGTTSSVEKITNNIKSLDEHIDSQVDVNNLVNTSVGDIMNSIKNVSSITSEKMKMMNKLVNVIEIGGEKIKDTNIMIQSVSKTADEMIKMIELITDIANQINTLSINASIESARAGKYGEGFKVVSNEIRKLAVTTNSNTENITNQLEQTVDTMRLALEKSKESGDTFIMINEEVRNVADTLNEIKDNMFSLAEKSDHILQNINNMSEASNTVKNQSTQIKESAISINNSIHSVDDISTEMLSEMDKIDNYAIQLNLLATQLYALGLRNNRSMNILNKEIHKFKLSEEDHIKDKMNEKKKKLGLKPVKD